MWLAKDGESSGIEDHDEHATAVLFFTKFAQDHPAFRRYLLEPNGLPLLVERFKIASTSLPVGINGCPAYAESSTWALHCASGFKWAIPTVCRLDICPYLIQSLLHVYFILPTAGYPPLIMMFLGCTISQAMGNCNGITTIFLGYSPI